LSAVFCDLLLMNMARKKILWLCSWYPSKIDPFDGDFVQRHARAAGLYHDIHVIRIVPDKQGLVTQTVSEEKFLKQQVLEQFVYFRKSTSWTGRLLGAIKSNRLYKKAVREYIEKKGMPDLIHVHVPMPAGRPALWARKKFGTRFLVTEHSTMYNEKTVAAYSRRSRLFRETNKRIINAASMLLTVSRDLGEAMSRLVTKKSFRVIPNTVDTRLFCYKEMLNDNFRFIHVSTMVPRKNVKGILEAFLQLRDSEANVELHLVGNKGEEEKNYAASIGLNEAVFFHGEIPYDQVAAKMQNSDALVLFSDMENSPCVIGEALCCGLPVIATKVGGIPELINSENGLLVQPGNIDGLRMAMHQMITNKKKYDKKNIADVAANIFSYPVIGKLFDEVYAELTMDNTTVWDIKKSS
jgi:glycosyltransferase involved in cell wall biosynthesis